MLSAGAFPFGRLRLHFLRYERMSAKCRVLLVLCSFFLCRLPFLDGFRNFPIPVFHVEVIGRLAIFVAERGIGAVVHEADGYFRGIACHQRRQTVHIQLVGVCTRLDEEFNERNQSFRRFFPGSDQVEWRLLAGKETFVHIAACLDQPFENGGGKAGEPYSARMGV